MTSVKCLLVFGYYVYASLPLGVRVWRSGGLFTLVCCICVCVHVCVRVCVRVYVCIVRAVINMGV